MSHRNVFAFHKDKRGFMWVGTQYGLNRFDGHDFKSFTKEKNGLSSNEIDQIIEDANGNLWLFHSQNWYYDRNPLSITVFNPYTETVVSLDIQLGKGLDMIDLQGYISSPSKSLFFGSKEHLIKYRPTTGFQLMKIEGVHSLNLEYYSTNHTLWAKNENNNLVELDTLGNILRNVPYPKSKTNTVHIEVLQNDDEGNLFFVEYTDNSQNTYEISSIHYLDTKGDFHKENIPFSEERLQTNDWSRQVFYQSPQNFYWLKSEPNLYAFHTEKGMIYDFIYSQF